MGGRMPRPTKKWKSRRVKQRTLRYSGVTQPGSTVGAFPTVGFCGLHEPTVRRALTAATVATMEVRSTEGEVGR
jgi:hypothetical protein